MLILCNLCDISDGSSHRMTHLFVILWNLLDRSRPSCVIHNDVLYWVIPGLMLCNHLCKSINTGQPALCFVGLSFYDTSSHFLTSLFLDYCDAGSSSTCVLYDYYTNTYYILRTVNPAITLATTTVLYSRSIYTFKFSRSASGHDDDDF